MKETEFLELIRDHQNILHKICRLYRDSKEDREDLFQDIIFQLWKSAPTFEGKSKFSTWMCRIAFNTAITTFRTKKPDIKFHEALPDLPDPGQETNDQKDKLFHALRQLNDPDKTIITLYLEDMTYAEIAQITGITENNVGVKLNRIKNRIQQLIK